MLLNVKPEYLVHDGGHLKYNIYVKEQLDYIYNNYDDIESYRYQFWLLQKHHILDFQDSLNASAEVRIFFEIRRLPHLKSRFGSDTIQVSSIS